MNKPLDNLSRVAAPSEAFKERLWQRLDAEYTFDPVIARRRRLQWASGILSVGFLLSGTGTYAYVSPSVTPDDALYPVKTGIEWVEEQTRFTPEAEIRFHERMMRRRAAELEDLGARPEIRVRLERHRMRHLERHDALIQMLESGEMPVHVPPPVGLQERIVEEVEAPIGVPVEDVTNEQSLIPEHQAERIEQEVEHINDLRRRAPLLP